MADERITETHNAQPHTTVIERRGGGGGIAIAIVLLVAVLIGGFYLFSRGGAENQRDAAVTSAAKSVGDTAEKAGDAISGDGK
ncbi:hypothetical protein SUS17_1028 [Sphingomonas sp. S17]|jgi:hypothetical protein|uniref:Uncharacterized protein n=2 Tax=Sphingomonas paucimobilis TaxID=13689 RepID=A0A411LHB4_SPHPI|nr:MULTISPECIES: hypothetical protein [Sphingomonas]EGI56301.1 hypothetical protein SUS17_1028 [Sphingomonas sp. S17]MBQ1481183.1 hypothetical protein [Sphingomonas sp.]MCM3677854.1 hypothetical protein [Sphingomonas paucimobilis]MDG5972482.1 hypothetical protein [Sphingomonas paucimobilis]NNG57542.1 hypothetical protein [Sphingomonas paucimobilis]